MKPTRSTFFKKLKKDLIKDFKKANTLFGLGHEGFLGLGIE